MRKSAGHRNRLVFQYKTKLRRPAFIRGIAQDSFHTAIAVNAAPCRTCASNFATTIADSLSMSLPRAIVPGRRYMITRRCSERRFFMRPDLDNNTFVYCLALAARKAGVSIVCAGTGSVLGQRTDFRGRGGSVGNLGEVLSSFSNGSLPRQCGCR
jgi:hypothetical protein